MVELEISKGRASRFWSGKPQVHAWFQRPPRSVRERRRCALCQGWDTLRPVATGLTRGRNRRHACRPADNKQDFDKAIVLVYFTLASRRRT